ncbi:hypothetical protein NKJ32_34885, partial [Mesorhizobium sp. M0159]
MPRAILLASAVATSMHNFFTIKPATQEPSGSRLFRELKDLGYGGGSTAVTDFLRDVRPAAAERGYEVRFETPPG